MAKFWVSGAVHVNRVIRQLREEGILDYYRGRVRIINETALQALVGYDARYLHQDGPTSLFESARVPEQPTC